jgi:hypothetical protein
MVLALLSTMPSQTHGGNSGIAGRGMLGIAGIMEKAWVEQTKMNSVKYSANLLVIP